VTSGSDGGSVEVVCVGGRLALLLLVLVVN